MYSAPKISFHRPLKKIQGVHSQTKDAIVVLLGINSNLREMDIIESKKKNQHAIHPEIRLITVQVKTFEYLTTHRRYKSSTQEASTAYPHTVNLHIC